MNEPQEYGSYQNLVGRVGKRFIFSGFKLITQSTDDESHAAKKKLYRIIDEEFKGWGRDDSFDLEEAVSNTVIKFSDFMKICGISLNQIEELSTCLEDELYIIWGD